ncbi:MAG: YihY/virulence factor BrkB family protein [Candidatus Kapaibacterium sp.]
MIKKRLNNLFFYLKRLYQKYDTDQIWFLSSGVSFSILWVIIPTLLIFLGILGFYFDQVNAVQKINEYINQTLPVNFEMKDKVIAAISSKALELSNNAWITTLIGLLGVFWTMSSMFSYMRDALNRIFDVKESVTFLKGKLRDFVLLLIIIVLFSFTTIVTSAQQIDNEFINFIFHSVTAVMSSSVIIIFLLPFIVSYVMFFFLYRFVPHYQIPTKAVLFGTLISAVLYELIKYGFAYYIMNLSNYTAVYGAYAAIVVFLLWIYVMSLIFCTGAALSKIYMELHSLELKFYNKEKYGTKKIIPND